MSGISSLTSSHSTHSLSDVWANADDRERALKDAWLESREAIKNDPITYSTLKDPVVDEGGHTFNRSTLFQLPIAIDDHKEEIPNHVVCPIGRELIDLTKLRFSYHAKDTVAYLAQERTVDYLAQEQIRSGCSSSSSSSSCSSSSSSVSSSSGSSSSTTSLDDLMRVMRASIKENRKTARTVVQLKETCAVLRQDNEVLKETCAELRKDNQVLKASNQRLETRGEELQTELQQVKTVNQRLETGVQELQTVNQGLGTRLQQVQTELQQVKTVNQGLETRLQQVQTDNQNLKTKIVDLEASKKSLSKSQDTNKALYIRCKNLEGMSCVDTVASLFVCGYGSAIRNKNLTMQQRELIREYDATITTTR